MIGILVDLDGVLWFSESAHKIAFKQALSPIISNASEIVDETWQFGESTEKYLGRLNLLCNLKFTENEIAALMFQKRECASQIEDIPVNVTLINALKIVKNSEVLIALVSSSSPSNVRKFLEKANLVGFFDFIVDSSMVESPKPEPDCYSLAMRELGLLPRECTAIEDSESGRISAIKAGIPRIKVYPDDFSSQDFVDVLLARSRGVF